MLEVRCPPALEEAARANFNADRIVVDPTMAADRLAVTPFAYAENISVEIGFQNPKELN